MDRAWPLKGRAGPSVISPARNARSTKIRGPSRERRRAVHHYRRYPRSRYGKSTAALRVGVRACNLRLRAEPATPGRVGAQGAQEVHLAEGGPVGVAEVELRVG